MLLLYQEHAAQARQQEAFKTIWSVTSAVLLPARAIAAIDPARQFVCGILLCATGVTGTIMLGKHQERYELHLRVMRGFRGALAKALPPEIPAISAASRRQHGSGFRPFGFIGIRTLWMSIHVLAIITGGLLAWRAEPPLPLVVMAPGETPPVANTPADPTPASALGQLPPASSLTQDSNSP